MKRYRRKKPYRRISQVKGQRHRNFFYVFIFMPFGGGIHLNRCKTTEYLWDDSNRRDHFSVAPKGQGNQLNSQAKELLLDYTLETTYLHTSLMLM